MHPTPRIDVAGLHRLADVKAIDTRLRLPGPHLTMVMEVATPGRSGDDTAARWRVMRHDLAQLGADAALLDVADQAIDALPPCGYPVVLTANEHDAAHCWLPDAPADPFARLDDRPSLAPVIAEVADRPNVIAASVDRTGADLYAVDHAHIDAAGTVDGEHDRIHKSAGDGWDQARNQRHSELVWSRNAHLVADAIVSAAARHRADTVVLTGDLRATDLVASYLASRPLLSVSTAHAGGRHESDTPHRLLRAAFDAAAAAQRRTHDVAAARLQEELGQQDRAVDGDVHTREALGEHRVATLFVDSDHWARHAHLDEMIAAAYSSGAEVIVRADLGVTDGIAALLRRPYHQEDSP